ncbi:tyrosine--tRNA ligase, mitochondrial [Ixodes scapularis]
MFRLKLLIPIAKVTRLLQIEARSRVRFQAYSKEAFRQLLQRGVIQEVFPPENDEVGKLFSSKQCVYCGFDPTSDSLHVGNLLAIVLMIHMQRMGHDVIAVIGDSTAQIGDPSGRLTERDKMADDTIERNVAGIRDNLETIFINHEEHFWKDGASKPSGELGLLRIVRNSDWYNGQGVIPFLGTVGRHFRLGKMMCRTSVQQRIRSGEGISFTEFSYQMFQSYDWLYLYDKYKCRFQIGGGDQLGNIDSGHDLLRRTRTQTAYGILVPLITAETGDKYGKSAGNAVWLNPRKTSPYELYQFFMRLTDTEAVKFLRLFTFAEQTELDNLIEAQMKSPEKRVAQKRLARDVTLLVHGERGLSLAQNATEILFGGSRADETLHRLDEEELRLIFGDAGFVQLVPEPGTTVLDMAMKARLFPSKEDAVRIISAGGFYINQHRVNAPSHVIVPGVHVLPNKITLARVGKKNYYLIKWIS